MSLLVSDAIDRIQKKLNILNQNADEGDIISFLNDAVDYFYQTYNLPTAQRISELTLFGGVSEYELPSDFASPISPRNVNPYESSSIFRNTRERDIYTNPLTNQLSVRFDQGSPYLVAKTDEETMLLSDCQDADVVVVSGDGSDSYVDNIVKSQGTGSLRFKITGSAGSTTLTFTLDPVADISSALESYWAFIDLYCPRSNTTALTSVRFRLGSDSSNYYEVTATTSFRYTDILGGWNKIGFNLLASEALTKYVISEEGALIESEDGRGYLVTEGTPDTDSIVWMEITITHGTSGVDGIYRIDNIFLSEGAYQELPYYSTCVIENTSGVRKVRITETDDTILFPSKRENGIIYKAMEILGAERLKDQSVVNYAARELATYENSIKAEYPKETMLRQTFRYRRANRF